MEKITLKSPILKFWLETALENRNRKRQFTLQFSTTEKSNIKAFVGGIKGKMIEINNPMKTSGMSIKLKFNKNTDQWDVYVDQKYLNYVIISTQKNTEGKIRYLSLMEPEYFEFMRLKGNFRDSSTGELIS
ncbi:hypothetical protein [Spiroplasma diminutum]|uniref:Uncharacterized protein n=1 Tax=Spiroplasma diminutum CUAS-1 TaxID=1276221 RepID=S5MEH6_9MOLU|nr:hypothetical protein [Spiroplasma diminutum]AGR42158.1 hypothetical protein SDIMI_v3c04540 [Spiroplasma diminutum CUAS-1]